MCSLEMANMLYNILNPDAHHRKWMFRKDSDLPCPNSKNLSNIRGSNELYNTHLYIFTWKQCETGTSYFTGIFSTTGSIFVCNARTYTLCDVSDPVLISIIFYLVVVVRKIYDLYSRIRSQWVNPIRIFWPQKIWKLQWKTFQGTNSTMKISNKKEVIETWFSRGSRFDFKRSLE